MMRRDAIEELQAASFVRMPEPEIRSVKTSEVIEINYIVGLGIQSSVVRWVREYWTLDGKLIAKQDPAI